MPELELVSAQQSEPDNGPDLVVDPSTSASVADAGPFSFGPVDAARNSAAAVAARLRQNASRDNPAGGIVKAAVGGLIGLVLGYYALNLFGGPRFDLLSVCLPGCPHTYGHSPGSSETTLETPFGEARSMPRQMEEAGEEAGQDDAPSELNGNAGMSASGQIGVRDATHYTMSAITDALRAAHRTFGCEACQSTGRVWTDHVTGNRTPRGSVQITTQREQVPCEACQGHPRNEMTAEAYAECCRLARLVTFAEAPSRDPTDPWLAEVTALMERAGASWARCDEIGRLADEELLHTHRTESGIFLAGTVQAIRTTGSFSLARLQLSGTARAVPLVSDRPFPFQTNDEILVLGSVIRDPVRQIDGFDGTQPWVVWHGLAVPVPSP